MRKLLLFTVIFHPLCYSLFAQPVEVKEIDQGAKNLTALGSFAYYSTSNTLYKSDGTSIGTITVKTGLSNPSSFFTHNNLLFFLNNDNELWRSDGTGNGTFLLKKSNSIAKVNSVSSYVFFTSEDDTYGKELYRTDGTVSGTILLKDIYPGSASSGIGANVGLGNMLLFTAIDPDHGRELWKTDGSSTGTILLKDIKPGTASGMTPTYYYRNDLYASNGIVFFTADDSIHGNELWKSDGTSSGTVMVKDLTVGDSSTNIRLLGVNKANNRLIFYSDTTNANYQFQVDFRLWSSDGTSEGTQIIYNWVGQDSEYDFIQGTDITYKGKYIFLLSTLSSYHKDFYSTDGTSSGTSFIKDLGNFPDDRSLYTNVANNYLIFYGTDEGYYNDFWRSDGTEAGTNVFYHFKDDSYGPWDFTKVGNLLYFSDNDGPTYYGTVNNADDFHQLIQTDVNTAQSLRSIYGISLAGTREIEDANGKLFFITYNDHPNSIDKSTRLWTYDPSRPPVCASSGKILREYWTNVPGYAISDIPVDSTPTSTSMPTLFEGPQNIGDNYGERYRAYICVPETGDYTFYISSDDNSELWLSTGMDTSNIAMIASVKGYTNYRQWDKYASQKSSPVHLIAGRKYFIQALHKEATGNDHISVGWQLPDGSLERPILGNRLSPFTGYPNFEPRVSITSPTNGQTFNNPVSITINAQASDSNGAIVQVEFYQGTTLLGKDTTAPYGFIWNNVASGTYALTVKAYDNGGAVATSSEITITVNGSSSCSASGTILRELWTNISGTAVSAIPTNTPPNSTSQLTIFEGPSYAGDNYGARYRGYICVPTTGNYTFWIASDDNGELWLSTDSNPANKVKIANVPDHTAIREWAKYTSQKSALIHLVAGQKYYVEALHKEATGGDNLAVGGNYLMEPSNVRYQETGFLHSPVLQTYHHL